MQLNRYEHSRISNTELPNTWQSQESLDELSDFLQQNWEQREIFYQDKEINSKQQFLDFVGSKAIKTKRYIGTIVFKGEQLNIYPWVFGNKGKTHCLTSLTQRHLVFNLVKWIQYCNKSEYPFIDTSCELSDLEELKDIFISLYISYVDQTLNRGLYYQYIDKSKDCSFLKGKFDIKDYVISKMPNGNTTKFKCTYSDFEFDNSVNRIIKYTCSQLLHTTNEKNKKVIGSILAKLNNVTDVHCYPGDFNIIRLSSMHKDYAVIIGISRMLLLNQTSIYSGDDTESFCFLFPTHMLFEGFVGGFVKEFLEKCDDKSNVKVDLQETSMNLIEKIVYNGQTSGPVFAIRPDIQIQFQGKKYVLDTKYKGIPRFENNSDYRLTISKEINQSDLYQILEYARKTDAKDVYLLYPMYRNEQKENCFPMGISKSPSGNINVHFIRLPFVFEEGDNTESQLTDVIKQIFNDSETKIL